jgi:hypothetical protein
MTMPIPMPLPPFSAEPGMSVLHRTNENHGFTRTPLLFWQPIAFGAVRNGRPTTCLLPVTETPDFDPYDVTNYGIEFPDGEVISDRRHFQSASAWLAFTPPFIDVPRTRRFVSRYARQSKAHRARVQQLLCDCFGNAASFEAVPAKYMPTLPKLKEMLRTTGVKQ